MSFCSNCGAQVQPGEKFCTSCGSKIEELNTPAAESAVTGAAAAVTAAAAPEAAPAPQEAPAEPVYQPASDPVHQPAEEPVYQSAPSPDYQQDAPQTYTEQAVPGAEGEDADIAGNKGMSVLAYIGVLVLIPLFFRKDSKFARFNINQGLVLMFIEVAANLINKVCAAYLPGSSGIVGLLCFIVWVVCIVLSIMGIVNAAKGRYKKLPIVGGVKIL